MTRSWSANRGGRTSEGVSKRCARPRRLDTLKLKDLRDTYASTLITHGIVLHWISIQLEHGSLAVTERHYAKYMAVDSYQNPWIVPPGSVPSDLFTMIESRENTETHHDFTSR
jgi:integrase